MVMMLCGFGAVAFRFVLSSHSIFFLFFFYLYLEQHNSASPNNFAVVFYNGRWLAPCQYIASSMSITLPSVSFPISCAKTNLFFLISLLRLSFTHTLKVHYNYAIKCTAEANRYSSSIYPLARLTRAADFLFPSTDFDLKKKKTFLPFSLLVLKFHFIMKRVSSSSCCLFFLSHSIICGMSRDIVVCV